MNIYIYIRGDERGTCGVPLLVNYFTALHSIILFNHRLSPPLYDTSSLLLALSREITREANIILHKCWFDSATSRRDGLVGYDAALTQLRSWVRFPFLVFLPLC